MRTAQRVEELCEERGSVTEVMCVRRKGCVKYVGVSVAVCLTIMPSLYVFSHIASLGTCPPSPRAGVVTIPCHDNWLTQTCVGL